MASRRSPKFFSLLRALAVILIAFGVATLIIARDEKSTRPGDRSPTAKVATGVSTVGVLLLFAANRRKTPHVNAEHPVILPPAAAYDSEEADAAPPDLLPISLVRNLMGSVPRKFDASLQRYLHVDPPGWLKGRPDDEMNDALRAQDRLRRDGQVVWAAVVQANSLIWKPGLWDHGASIIWSVDPSFDADPTGLQEIAQECFALKGVDQADPASAAFSRMLTNEMSRANKLPVPSRFVAGREMFHSSLMIHRKHLPEGRLTRALLPIWVEPATGLVLLVPAAYWPASLTHFWKDVAPVEK